MVDPWLYMCMCCRWSSDNDAAGIRYGIPLMKYQKQIQTARGSCEWSVSFCVSWIPKMDKNGVECAKSRLKIRAQILFAHERRCMNERIVRGRALHRSYQWKGK